MRKLAIGFLITFLASSIYAADPTSISIGQQINLALLSDVSVVGEHTAQGQDKMAFLDGFAQFGHYQGDYILALDGGFLDQKGGNMTWGIHVHAFQALFNFLSPNLSPSVKTFFNTLKIDPRYSLDQDGDGHAKGVLSVTFGAQIQFQ